MLRHIVVEGVDGSGKSTLIQELAKWRSRLSHPGPHFTLPKKRSSTSVGGPVPDLDQWVDDDARVRPFRTPTLYDRHPVISEPIYGPIVRDKLPGRFNSPTWLGINTNRLAHDALVIWCSPPWPVVYDNIQKADQMPGVAEHARDLWAAYRHAAVVWPGVQLRYDYTRTTVVSVLSHIATLFGGYSGHRAA